MDRWEGRDYARPIILFIHYKFWLLNQSEVSVPLTYNGRNCGSCDNLKTARYFLVKLNKWIDGKMEIMHVFFILLIRPKRWLLWQLEVSIGLLWEKVDPSRT